ncbi:MAG: glycosyltransferase [Planctomycetaceae bacterium]|jgi:glycosyltransferase involved in cell wall biosynthesis|nr:glycosyltransferase [Planctomycetaceae bacterium]
MRKVFIFGYPGDMGGANTECWHTVKLWRKYGIDVHLVPTWGIDSKWKRKLDEIGCVTHQTAVEQIDEIPDLEGSITIGFCNRKYIEIAPKLRQRRCKIVWVNCMTFLFDHEKHFFEEHGPVDAMVYQSSFQQTELERDLKRYGYHPQSGHLIHGAFDTEAWSFRPTPHVSGETFTVGRVARPDRDKWSSNTWKIYEAIPYSKRRALMLGVNYNTVIKLGPLPIWADCLKPMAIPVQQYYACLHCLLPINGGARENWPRTGLEAMACGVPIVTQNQWGWQEMILHGETGFLGNDDAELAYYAAKLAYDENLRMQIAESARQRLVNELTNPELLWKAWNELFDSMPS